MWKQKTLSFSIFVLYCVILFNGAIVLKRLLNKFTSHPGTCTNTGKSLELCPFSPLPATCRRVLYDLNPSDGLVLGKPRIDNVLLSIGVVSTKGEEERTVNTLTSLTRYISSADYSDVVIVVVYEGELSAPLLKRLQDDFSTELDSSLIHVIHPTDEFLRKVNKEPLGWRGMKLTEGFKQKETQFNKRFFFLAEYCFRISKNFLMLSNQAYAAKPFLPAIRQKISDFEANNISDYAHDFGQFALPSFGRLLSSKMTGQLAELGTMFPSGNVAHGIVDLHYGLRASASKTRQPDNDFLFTLGKESRGVKPDVEFKFTLRPVGDHSLSHAYKSHDRFAWFERPKKDQHFIMTFREPLLLSRILIESGSPLYRDPLTDGALWACKDDGQSNCDESQCTMVSQFADFRLDATNLENSVNFPVKCLRFAVSAEQTSWVIIRDISLWEKEQR